MKTTNTAEFYNKHYTLANGIVCHKSTGDAVSTVTNLKGYVYHRTHLIHRMVYALHHKVLPNELDHKNRIKSDNRIDNIRPSTRRQNTANRDVWTGKGYKFLYVETRTKVISYNARTNYTGHVKAYDNIKTAAFVSDLVALAIYGDFACTNLETDIYGDDKEGIRKVLTEQLTDKNIERINNWAEYKRITAYAKKDMREMATLIG